jgi:hypothetical protein
VGDLWNGAPGDDNPWARVFGLNDNPFNPTSMPAVGDTSLLNELYKRALRIDLDHALEDLFVPDAGPFARYVMQFGKLLQIAGYRRYPVRTRQPFAFLVSGEQGTGKSTLVSAFARWLSVSIQVRHSGLAGVVREGCCRPARRAVLLT